METKAHHFLIGSVALLTVVAGIILVIWLMQVSFEETLPYRVFSEDPVTDLSSDAAVRMNGVRIGSVGEIILNPARPKTVLITIEINSDIVINEDTTATLETEGFVGPTYVGITPGRLNAPTLRHDAPEPPVIPYQRSGLNQIMDTVMDTAPELLDRVLEITTNLEAISGEIGRHREQIGTMIADAATTASSFERVSEEAVGLVNEAGNAVQRANDLIAQLDDVVGRRLEPMMANVDETLSGLAGAAGEAEQLIAENRKPIDQFATHGLREMRQLLSETRHMIDAATKLVALLERHPTSVLFGAPQPTFRPEAR